MKKIKFWSLMLGFTFGSLAFVACGDDKDDTNTTPPTENKGGDNNGNDGNGGSGGNGQTVVNIVGTWQCSFTGEDGSFHNEKMVLGENGSFEGDVKSGYQHWTSGGATIRTNEQHMVGEYKKEKEGVLTVIIKERYETEYDAVDNPGGLVKVDMEKNDTLKREYASYGNGMLTMGLVGHILFYTKNGEARRLPTMANHELLGKWVCRTPAEYEPNREYVYTYEVKADGSVTNTSMMVDTQTNAQIQGMRENSFFVTVPDGFMGFVRNMEGIPANAKFFSLIVQSYSRYEMKNDGTGYAWLPTYAGNGGHPMMYEIKDGKLYVGTIGMGAERFYENAYVKQ